MTYESFCKNKDYAMTYVVPAFRKYGVSTIKTTEKDEIIYNHYGQPEKEINLFQKYANNIAYCGVKKNFKVCKNCGDVYWDGFDSCKNRFCPVCQKAKSLILFAKLYPSILKLLSHGYIIKLLTFTIKDTESLKDGVWLIKTAYRKCTHENKKYRQVFDNLYIGGIKSLEVKRGANSKQWHPHFHALVVAEKPEEDFKALNIMWNKTLVNILNNRIDPIYEDRYYSDSFSIVNDKLVFNDKVGFIQCQALNSMSMHDRIKCIYESIKYITKYSDNMEDDLPELVNSLKGIRAVDSWGVLRDIEQEAEKLQTMTISQIKEHVCTTCGSKEFETIDGIMTQDLPTLGYKTEIKDFDTKQNKLEKRYENTKES